MAGNDPTVWNTFNIGDALTGDLSGEDRTIVLELNERQATALYYAIDPDYAKGNAEMADPAEDRVTLTGPTAKAYAEGVESTLLGFLLDAGAIAPAEDDDNA